MSGRFVSRLGVIAIMGGLLGVGAASASAQCLANEIQKLTASNGSLGDHFGTSVSILGEMALVGATAGNGAENGTGAAYVYRFDPLTSQWNEQQILAALDGFWPDAFGISVAIDPVDPNVVIVGAYLDDDACPEDILCNSGSGYIFRFDPDTAQWAQEQK
ncbi:MAG: FG-GAP repeat protein, partial [Planctomycetes bacterium]|nr:FG-GAP repeat protein [Planctomycetota bacterium]